MSGPIVLPPPSSAGFGWFPARDAIAAILLAVTITDPIATNIKRVYKYRPDTETDFPCVVIPGPPAKERLRGPSGYRARFYDVPLHLMVKDADPDREANILDAFEDAIDEAFDDAVTLGLFAGYHVEHGPTWEEGGSTTLADSSVAGIVVGRIRLKLTDGRNYIG